jgi:RNA polymerase sigma factor (sigma-70 family)
VSDTPLIHVVDDDEPLRTSLLRLLRESGFEVRGYGSTGEFLLHPPTDRGGCLLLDLQLPGGPSGLDLQSVLREHGVSLPVIFLTAHGDVAASVRAMKAGAVDFLTKPVGREELFDAIRRALDQDAAERNARDDSTRLRRRFTTLTPREREVFERVAAGRLNKQIADELGVSERTVKAQRASVLAKLAVGSVAELGRLAEQLRRLQGA